jgi:hypothetical protein
MTNTLLNEKQKWYIPLPLHAVKNEENPYSAYGYDPDVNTDYNYGRPYKGKTAEYEYVGFLVYKNLEPDANKEMRIRQTFIPSEPHHDHGYIDRVYVITKAGYITKCGYPNHTCVWVEEGTILAGVRCSQHSYGISMAKEKARPWVEKGGI